MDTWHKFVGYIWDWTAKHAPWMWHPVTWLSHGLIAALIVLAMATVGLESYGFAAGVGFFACREIEAVLERGVCSEWWDHLGDVLGPVVFGLLAWWIVA